jgi:hypothetical protein
MRRFFLNPEQQSGDLPMLSQANTERIVADQL